MHPLRCALYVRQVEAVVDKDLSSALLARKLGATRFIILTAVDEVMVDFGQPTQRALRATNVKELRQHAKDRQFPPGSMGPKVEAVLAFLDGNPGAEVLVTSPQASEQALGNTAHRIASHGVTSHGVAWHHMALHHITSHHITSHPIPRSHPIPSHPITSHLFTGARHIPRGPR